MKKKAAMSKRLISYFKKRHPKCFYYASNNYWMVRILSEMDRLRYIKCMLRNKPYFGILMMASQIREERKPFMRQLVRSCISGAAAEKKYYILEIGSWAGESAIVWANAIRDYNKGNGLVVCIDPWEPYLRKEQDLGLNVAPLIIDDALKRRKMHNLFLHNIRTTNNADIIKPYKGRFSQLAPTLKNNFFDIVFIDGPHPYLNVINDLANAKALVCDGGIICGDDLELQKKEIDIKNAEENKEKDIIIDTKTKKEFHPGVSLAVAEFFGGEVSCYEGFWAMRKKGSCWEKVEINPD